MGKGLQNDFLAVHAIAPDIGVKSQKFSSSCIFVFGNIWMMIGIYHPHRCLIFPTWGQLCAHSRNWTWFILSLITIINCQVFNNCNQPSGTYWSLMLGICKVQETYVMILHLRKVASCLRDKINKHGILHPWSLSCPIHEVHPGDMIGTREGWVERKASCRRTTSISDLKNRI